MALALLMEGCAPRPQRPVPSAPAPEPEASLPEIRVVSDGGEEVPAVRGSYCWSGSGRSVCADSVAPPELVASLSPAPVPRESILGFRFARRPVEGSLEVRRWTGTASERVRFVRPGAFALPEQSGEYVYSVSARWPEGDVTWAFRVRVTKKRA